MSRSFWIDGIATVTIATSRIVMKNAAPTTARTSHFLSLCSAMPRPPSVTKVTTTREDHSASGARHRLDDLGVALRASGLDQRGHSTGECLLRPVCEREERV